MMMRILKLAAITTAMVIFSVAGFAQAQQTKKTNVLDRAAAASLLGRHKVSLQWISWDYYGSVTVSRSGGTYSIDGGQKGRGESSDFLSISGDITRIDRTEFVFEGTIITQVSHINGGRPCKREGEFVFRITGKRRYWRLAQMNNPCDPVTDYVDIYFR